MMIKLRLLIFLLLWAPLVAPTKERFAYLYIQGDKQTPFYLRLDGAMQPRYGKNYCILPQLAPGPLTIEILFQQNVLPPEKFTVLIPDGGSRGFLLVKKEDAYELYDLQQGFYLKPGNAAEDDRMPPDTPATVVQEPPAELKKQAETKKHPEHPSLKEKAVALFAKKQEPEKKRQTPQRHPAKSGPDFIPNVELGHSGAARVPPEPERQMPIRDSVMQIPSSGIANSDCPNPMPQEEFEKIFSAMSAHLEEEQRLEYILGQMDKCYLSWQARSLAQMLRTEAARFTLLKHIYPRISDQSSFPLLDDLFTTATWRDAFTKLIHP